MNMIRPSTALLLGSLALVSFGCGPRQSRDVAGARVEANPPKTDAFLTKVNAIRPGTREAVVLEQLGAPDQRTEGMVDPRPEPGPAEELPNVATPGTRFRQWTYKRGDSHYHVFFTRGTRGGDIDWEVLTVRSMPKDAVY